MSTAQCDISVAIAEMCFLSDLNGTSGSGLAKCIVSTEVGTILWRSWRNNPVESRTVVNFRLDSVTDTGLSRVAFAANAMKRIAAKSLADCILPATRIELNRD